MSLFICTGNPECSGAFLSQATLERVVTNNLAIVGGPPENTGPELVTDQQRLFPDMRFTCNATIRTLIIGADISTLDLSAVPEVQVWRVQTNNSDLYSRVSSVQLSADMLQEVPLSPGVYTLQTSLSASQGDILGIFYPQRSNVVLHSLANQSMFHSRDVVLLLPGQDLPESFQVDNSTLSSSRQWPLVTFDDGKTILRGAQFQQNAGKSGAQFHSPQQNAGKCGAQFYSIQQMLAKVEPSSIQASIQSSKVLTKVDSSQYSIQQTVVH